KAGTGKRDIYLRYSKDFGSSWLPEFIDYRIDTDTPNPGDSVAPQIACDGSGHLYVVWMDDKNSPGRYEPYFRSIQFTFQSPVDTILPLQFPEVRLNVGEKDKPVTEGTFSTFTPQLASDGLGGVYVVWEDTREQAEKEIYPGIYFNASYDHGKTWRANDLRVDHRPVGFFRSLEPRMAVDHFGGIHVIWLDNAGRPIQQIDAAGRNKLFYNHSPDFGKTWRETDIFLSTVPKTTEVRNGVISVNDKRGVYVAWTDNSGGAVPDPADQTSTTTNPNANFHVFFNHSENGGATWMDFTERIQLDVGNSSSDAQNPQIAADDTRNVFVVWEDSRNSAFRNLYFNFSPDHGRKESWLPSDIQVDNPASKGNSTGTQMGTDGSGRIHIAWSDDRNAFGTSDIYYNSLLFDISTLIKGPRLAEACFIATAAYGSPLEPHVVLLRKFRDRYLLPHSIGRGFVAFYYHNSPPFARFLNEHPALKPAVRVALLPMVGLAGLCLQTTLLGKGAILVVLLGGIALVVRTRRRPPLR
ncbi:MAG: hypothetical protein HZA19_04030, partial [Nitrospirae bacterium]|nr:hypothetical protein [Nitrospirota bacterium]